MDCRPGAQVENVETCLASRFLMALYGFKDALLRKSGVSGRCFELAGRRCVFPCFWVGASAEDVDTCLTVGLHRSLEIRGVKNTWFLRGFGA